MRKLSLYARINDLEILLWLPERKYFFTVLQLNHLFMVSKILAVLVEESLPSMLKDCFTEYFTQFKIRFLCDLLNLGNVDIFVPSSYSESIL